MNALWSPLASFSWPSFSMSAVVAFDYREPLPCHFLEQLQKLILGEGELDNIQVLVCGLRFPLQNGGHSLGGVGNRRGRDGLIAGIKNTSGLVLHVDAPHSVVEPLCFVLAAAASLLAHYAHRYSPRSKNPLLATPVQVKFGFAFDFSMM